MRWRRTMLIAALTAVASADAVAVVAPTDSHGESVSAGSTAGDASTSIGSTSIASPSIAVGSAARTARWVARSGSHGPS